MLLVRKDRVEDKVGNILKKSGKLGPSYHYEFDLLMLSAEFP